MFKTFLIRKDLARWSTTPAYVRQREDDTLLTCARFAKVARDFPARSERFGRGETYFRLLDQCRIRARRPFLGPRSSFRKRDPTPSRKHSCDLSAMEHRALGLISRYKPAVFASSAPPFDATNTRLQPHWFGSSPIWTRPPLSRS